MDKLEKLAEAIINALIGKSIGYGLFLGLILSLCATTVTIFFVYGMPLFDHHPPVENGRWFLGEFFILLIVAMTVTIYMTFQADTAKTREAEVAVREAKIAEREEAISRREADDLLSDFRDKIAGIWEMSFRSWKFNDHGEPEEIKNTSHARFDVNEKTKKLGMRTRVKSDGEFDEENISIEAISIWPTINPKYLDYFHDLSLSHGHGEIVRGPVFVHLDIEYDGDRPARLRGIWYDLDGAFAKAQKETLVQARREIRGELPMRGRIIFTKLDIELAVGREAAVPEVTRFPAPLIRAAS